MIKSCFLIYPQLFNNMYSRVIDRNVLVSFKFNLLKLFYDNKVSNKLNSSHRSTYDTIEF